MVLPVPMGFRPISLLAFYFYMSTLEASTLGSFTFHLSLTRRSFSFHFLSLFRPFLACCFGSIALGPVVAAALGYF